MPREVESCSLRVRGRARSHDDERRIAVRSMRFGEILRTLRRPLGSAPSPLLSPPSTSLVSSVSVASLLFGGTSRPRRLSLPLRQLSLRAAPPMPRGTREREKGVVLLIAHNHAFHPRTPRPRLSWTSVSLFHPEARAVHPGWMHRTAPTPPHPSPGAVMKFTPWRNSDALLHRRLLRI